MDRLGQIILLVGLLSFFGCKDKAKQETFTIDGDTIKATTSTEDNYKPQLTDLAPEELQFITEKLKEAEKLVVKYCGQTTKGKFDSETLDMTLDKWKHDPDLGKKLPNEMVEIIGAAFGQGIVEELDCEWKVITDQYGQDITVIHKKYFVNGFPFSSVEKAATESEPRSLNDIKLLLKKSIQDSEKDPGVETRQ